MGDLAQSVRRNGLKVGIFWDIENYHPASGKTGHILAEAFRRIGRAYGSISVFKAFLDLSSTSPNERLRSELQSSGVSLTHCPRLDKQQKDVADKMLIADMMAFALDNPAPATVVLVSGDRDFAYALSVLRNFQYQVVLLHPGLAHHSLVAQADIVYNREEVLAGPRVAGATLRTPIVGALPMAHQEKSMPLSGDADSSLPFASGLAAMDRDNLRLDREPENVDVALYGSREEERSLSAGTSGPSSKTGVECTSSRDSSSSDERSETDSTPPSTVNSSYTVKIPPQFEDLVEILRECYQSGVDYVIRKTVKEILLERNPSLLESAGIQRFSQFVDMAEKSNIVLVGRSKSGGRWISIHPRLL